MPLDVRDLANRAELEFQRRPHRFRRVAWWSGVILALVCWGWLMGALLTDDNRVYEGGTLSHSHAFIANDCRQCHTTWQPVRRLTTGNPQVSSISNELCLKCHTAAEHQPHQIPAHDQMSCAECHREHAGQQQLAAVTDQHCARCHADLRTTAGRSRRFADHITGFGEADEHPEFNLIRRLKSDRTQSNLLTADELRTISREHPEQAEYQRQMLDVLAPRSQFAARLADSQWRDRSQIKFDHAAHLNADRIKDKRGQHVDLSKNCQACHVPDLSGRYMQPIQYEQHCARCHPLLFDNQNHPGVEVPHERPEVVRGFLTEKYTLAALKHQQPLQGFQPSRPLPGQPDRPSLNIEQAKKLSELVDQAELSARDHKRMLQKSGGCKYCHTITNSDKPDWQIQPPNIPNRWMPHSRFDHTAHRMLDCARCHADVAKKHDTADVMLPAIATCRECHVSTGTVNPLANLLGSSPRKAHLVQSNCVMCHTYHR